MNRILLLLLILVLPTSVRAGISIQEAIKKGYSISNLLKAQSNAEQAKYISIVNAKMARLFKIDGFASYQYKTKKPSSPFPGTGSIGTHHTYDLNIRISQSIWDGRMLAKKQNIAGIAHKLSGNQSEFLKIQISGAIISSYINYKSLLKRKKIQQALLDNLLLHERRIKELYKEQLLMRTDLLETQKLKLARINIINELKELIEIEVLEFRKLCGYSPEEVREWSVNNKFSNRKIMAYFEKNHPTMKMYNLKLSKEKLSGQIIQAGYQPHIKGYAGIHYGKPGVNFFKNEWQLYGEAGVNLSLKLFDWNRRKREKQINCNNIGRIKFEKNETYWEASKQIKQLLSSVEHIKIRLRNMENIIAIAEEECDLKRDLYSEHQISNIEYLRALTTKEENISQKEALACSLEFTTLRILITSGLIMEEK